MKHGEAWSFPFCGEVNSNFEIRVVESGLPVIYSCCLGDTNLYLDFERLSKIQTLEVEHHLDDKY